MQKLTCLSLLTVLTVLGCAPGDQIQAAGPATNQSESNIVKVKVYNRSGELTYVESPRVVKTDAQWLKQLGPATFAVARAKGTEAPFCGTLLDNHQTGVYTCVSCGLPLFASDAKFNSGTGWPSFFQPVAKENVIEHSDNAYGMKRVEILCARCDCHLGHVFEDGPRPTGLRFCVNSESLKFTKSDQLANLAEAVTEKGPTDERK